ncbi:MAG: EAL domain-containing protein [Lachnospiraceae bacterium]|nr:EAL domain-containing protein [Lachnospiraceae bacterium]
MDDSLKVRYFDDLFEIFSSQNEGWYAFYADYAHGKVHWSQEMVDFLGLPSRVMDEREALMSYINRIHPDDRDDFVKASDDMLAGKVDELNMPYRILDKEGNYKTVATFSRFKRDEKGEAVFYAGSVINYEKNDMIDPLTGLFTIHKLMNDMNKANEEKVPYSLMMISIRDFAGVNNRFGFMTGNSVLRIVGEILLYFRNAGLVYRLEGTKYAIMKTFDQDDESIMEFGKKEFNDIKSCINDGIIVNDTLIHIDVYGGATIAKDASISPKTIYTSTLFALEKAKEDSSDPTLHIFNYLDKRSDGCQLCVYNEIREAIIANCRGFYMVYQPIMSAKTGKLVAMESLIRWSNEKFGEIPPNQFIEWLEKDPIFYTLGSWIFKRSLTDAKKIIEKYPDFIVNVNLAYPQLERDDFEEKMINTINDVGIDTKNIRIELTERCKLLDPTFLKRRIDFIRSQGIQTALDDFGTGYSSIGLMFELPMDQIKIDRTFISDIENDLSKQIMLKAISDSAKLRNTTICVEGIEDKHMADFISKNYEVACLQGFMYSKPIRFEEFVNRIDDWM